MICEFMELIKTTFLNNETFDYVRRDDTKKPAAAPVWISWKTERNNHQKIAELNWQILTFLLPPRVLTSVDSSAAIQLSWHTMKAVKNTIFAPHAVDPGQVEQIWHLKIKLFSSLNFIGPHKIQLARTSVYLPGLQLTSSCFLLFSLLHSETSWKKMKKERIPVTFIIRRRGPINIWRTGECSNLTVIKILKGIKLFIKSDFRLVMPHVCWMSNERLIACNFTIAALLRACQEEFERGGASLR